MNDWNQLSPTMQTVVLVLGGIQVALWLIALIWWARTPAERMSLPRVAWLLIILFANGIGPIAWFIGGRRPNAVTQTAPVQEWASQQQRAVDTLYGTK
ncbi:PLD nuclease N-terminal domain-containing protein [Luteococcus sp. H138]|uniref:PLD nuclease N-terminal domain-containing protein n=1 Tax=unclassified Luteococcus TaxID=2639923 RepID=UPI00313ECC60